MSHKSRVTDDQVVGALGKFAAVANTMLVDPGRWLSLPPPSDGHLAAPLHRRTLAAASRKVFGEVAPGSPGWYQRPLEARIDWWVQRISNVAAVAAAAPRIGGMLSERVPLQAILGASGAGLVVCAVARESGVPDQQEWVCLLGKVIFDRNLTRAFIAEHFQVATVNSIAPPTPDGRAVEAPEEPFSVEAKGQHGTAHQAISAIRSLSRSLKQVESLLGERPRGGIFARTLAKAPVAGVAGGWLDERKAMRRAAEQTAKLLRQRAEGR